ncbi:LamG-like jellyroll fold domain-containing protein [Paenibacillus nasutitermitis]|uniref:LamG-like jellyroll fold domain-containing protein n=1 Tax=Paenibacillus nasutitermitis TaxID=1652958 RepID=A0A916YKQ5_9BACL|nr:LamG-like jellyroll fold domain-containing protein [Paenibacillus nasutitermitis]GGD50094.1 hypothetical protein GCM10010911_04550 [Paenibacillus nasutitermitis]
MVLKKALANICVICLVSVIVFLIPAYSHVSAESSGDAYINYDSVSKSWTLGTGRVEKVLQLNGSGQYLLKSFKNKMTSREYIQNGQISDEFSIKVGSVTYTGSSTGWTYDAHAITTLSQGELQLVVTFHNSVIKVSRTYIVYPSTGVIQEWSDFQNVSGSNQTFINPSMFRQRIMMNDISSTDFHYMTGGMNFTGSHVLKTVAASGGYARTFDSYDASETMTVDGQCCGQWNNPKYEGSAIYNQFFALRNRGQSDGVFLTFDYLGHWNSEMGNFSGNFLMNGKVIMPGKTVANNASITSPKSMTGTFQGDVDDMGNTILDYIYRYKWDYTRSSYFGQIKASQWLGMQAAPNVAQTPNAFQAINNARYIGADNFWIDDDWYDKKGNWNTIYGDDFKAINDYAAKNGMSFTVWYPSYHADAASTLLVEHPEYQTANDENSYYGYHLNNARTDVMNWQKNFLNGKQSEWGPHMWRNDGQPVYPAGGYVDWAHNTTVGDDNDALAQSNHFYDLLKQFKTDNPNAGIFGVASGAETLSIESVRYTDVQQLSDGYVNHLSGYWTSLIAPLDKLLSGAATENANWQSYSKNNRGNLSQTWFVQMNDASAAADKEGWRKDIDLYHYLQSIGVAGRWSKVYRPTVSSGDQTYYLQKMSNDNSKGYVTIRHDNSKIGSNVIVYPKGLIAGTSYTITSLEGSIAAATNTGSYWMSNGIPLTPLKRGEVLFFNVPNRPGAGADSTAPSAPSNVTKAQSSYLGKGGVEINWAAGNDDNWVSYYEVLRNGAVIDKVAKGTFYFDKYGTKVDSYQVRTVDGDGNVSSSSTASAVNSSVYKIEADFSSTQGRNNWYYMEKNGSSYSNMTWNGSAWKGAGTYNLIWEPGQLHPDTNDTVLAWKAPSAGTVRISGNVLKHISGGDGVKVKMIKNSSQLWPAAGWQSISGEDIIGFNHDIVTTVALNDMIYFVVNKNGDNTFDETTWMPAIAYNSSTPAPTPDIPVFQASKDFSWLQGQKGWFYGQQSGSTYSRMTWDNTKYEWKGAYTFNTLLSPTFMHPDTNDTVKSWKAPKPGTIRITGNVAKADAGGGDGINVKIVKNSSQVWPASGWQFIGATDKTGYNFDKTVNIAQGDTIHFILNKNGDNYNDLTNWNPKIEYTVVSDPSIKGSWKLNENTGTTAGDSSNIGNHGLLTNSPVWTTGKAGSAINFDGVNSFVNVPNSASLENLQEGDYTLAAWFKADTIPSGTGSDNNALYGIVMKPGYHLGLAYGSDQKLMLIHYLSNGANVEAKTATTYAPGTWYHVAGVVSKEKGTAEIYVNGSLKHTATFTPGTSAKEYNTSPWYIGIANPGASTYRWSTDGSIDEVMMYNKALSDAEVTALYNSY